MKVEDILDLFISEIIVFKDPDYDGCIIGVSTDGRAVYSYELMVAWLMHEDGCSEEDAVDFIEYNTVGAYIDDGPIVVRTFE